MPRILRIGPTDIELRMPQASDVTFEAEITRGTDPVDITLDTIYFTVKASRSPSAAVVLSLSNAPGAHSTPTAGRTVFSISDTDFADYEQAAEVRLWYEIRRVAASGAEIPHIAGTLVLEPVTGRS